MNTELPPKSEPLKLDPIEIPEDIRLIVEDIVKAHKENRIISIQRNNPDMSFKPGENPEQRILIRILK